MPNICQSNLTSALNVDFIHLLSKSVFGIVGIIGWGALYEKLLTRRPTQNFRILAQFSQGIVLVSILMLVGSLTGFCNVVKPVAIIGFLLALLILGSFLWRNHSKIQLTQNTFIFFLLFLIALPIAFAVMSEPLPFGDATAIWGYHAKALSCECLFRAHYTQENFWTGTHPEYPVLVPFLYSYFFSITESFRDDWAKIWLFFLLIEITLFSFEVLFKKSQSRWIALTGSIVLLTIFKSQAIDGRVEFATSAFATLLALNFLTGDFSRLPLYFFALAFTKNEGLASSFIFLSILTAVGLFKKKSNQAFRILAIAGVSLFFIGIILNQLPSNHEQYPSHLLSWHAWKQGIANLPIILNGAGRRLIYWPWALIFVFGTLSLLYYGVPFWAKRQRKPDLNDDYVILLTWPWVMLFIFLCIYIVTPWGPELHKVTFDRLLFQIFPPALFGLLGILANLKRESKTPLLAIISKCLLLILFLGYAIPLGEQTQLFLVDYYNRVKNDQVGLNAYLKHGYWKRGLKLDPLLPIASRGAILNEHTYFDINYMLYPRLIYSLDPNQVAGTSRPWKEWKKRDEVNLKSFGFEFLIDGEQVIERSDK
jgi:hypothetical protein